MGSTNKTTYYELSQYVGSDKPTYLGDYNADMLKIDTGLHTAADAADTALTTANSANSAATSASTTASTALSTAQTASATASQAQTTAETALTNSGAAQTAAEEAETAARANVITNLAPAYDPSLTYEVDELVTYIDSQGSGKLYKCIVAVTSPEAFNINKWDDVTTSEVYAQKKHKLSYTYSGATLTTIYNDLLNFLRTITNDQIINVSIIFERGDSRELSHCELFDEEWCYFDTIRTTYENTNIKGLRLNRTTGVFGEYVNRINRDGTITHIDQDLTVTSTITKMNIYY